MPWRRRRTTDLASGMENRLPWYWLLAAVVLLLTTRPVVPAAPIVLTDSPPPGERLAVGGTSGGSPSPELDRPAAAATAPDMWWEDEGYERGGGVRDVSSSVSSMVRLHCEVRLLYPLTTNLTIHWYKDGKRLNPRRSSRIRKKGNLLRLDDLMDGDSGNYTCRLSTPTTHLARTFRLAVTAAKPSHLPLISRGPVNVTVEEGQTAVLTCEIHNKSRGDTSLTMQWIHHILRNGSYEDQDGNPYTAIVNSSHQLRENPWTLTLRGVRESSEGWYTCLVRNSLGYQYHAAYLSVLSDKDRQRTGMSVSGAETFIDPTYYILGGVGGGVFLMGVTIVSAYICYKRQKRPQYHLSLTKEPVVSQPLMPHKPCRTSSTSSSASYPPPPQPIRIPCDPKWEFPRNQLLFLGQIGEGAFGIVQQATAWGTGPVPRATTVAVKMLRETATVPEQQDFVRELEVMKEVKNMGSHINIVNFLGSCTQGGPLLVIVEFAKNGNLRDFLESCRDGINGYGRYAPPQDPSWYTKTPGGQVINCKSLLSFAYQIARGMEFLSLNKCIHRDLAARNVLVTDNHVLKIADFGLTRTGDYYRKTTRARLPVKWMAPEALLDNKYTTKSDVWSFGIVLWEVFSLGGMPYPSLPNEELYTKLLVEGYRMPRPELASHSLYTIMERCWLNRPTDRPDFPCLVTLVDRLLMDSLSDDAYMDITQFLQTERTCLPS